METTKPNEHGALPPGRREIVARRGRAYAEVTLARADDGKFRYGLFLSSNGTGLAAPIAIQSPGFATAEAALAGGMEALLEHCVLAEWHARSVQQELNALRRQLLAKLRQPSLF